MTTITFVNGEQPRFSELAIGTLFYDNGDVYIKVGTSVRFCLTDLNRSSCVELVGATVEPVCIESMTLRKIDVNTK